MTDVTDLIWMNRALKGQKASHTQVERAYENVAEQAVNTIIGLQAQAATLQAELAEARRQLAEKKGELAVKTAQHAGALAQSKALKVELQAVAPDNKLFSKVGGVYTDGSLRTALDVVFENGFDKKLSEYNFPLPASRYRFAVK